jgi:hypothetical protein
MDGRLEISTPIHIPWLLLMPLDLDPRVVGTT